MSASYSGPSQATLRESLGEFIGEGLIPSNVVENGGALLELKILLDRLRLTDDADEEEREADYAAALREVMTAAVVKELIPGRKHRKILKYILPLKPEYLGTTIKERRAAAGEHLTDGKRVVKAGSVRTYPHYEPMALTELARVLAVMEADARGEPAPAESVA
jgi:hypothetical protein